MFNLIMRDTARNRNNIKIIINKTMTFLLKNYQEICLCGHPGVSLTARITELKLSYCSRRMLRPCVTQIFSTISTVVCGCMVLVFEIVLFGHSI